MAPAVGNGSSRLTGPQTTFRYVRRYAWSNLSFALRKPAFGVGLEALGALGPRGALGPCRLVGPRATGPQKLRAEPAGNSLWPPGIPWGLLVPREPLGLGPRGPRPQDQGPWGPGPSVLFIVTEINQDENFGFGLWILGPRVVRVTRGDRNTPWRESIVRTIQI